MWTNMRATASHFNFDDFGATAWTWCTFSVKNLGEFFEIVAFGAVCFDIGSHSGATGCNGFIHNIAGGF